MLLDDWLRDQQPAVTDDHGREPETAVGDRANVSQRILEMHYDQRTEKMEQRREYLGNI